ncbi:MAG TPA: hypothetical protein VFE76_03565, partial [Myxococcales bacterium]|nr:hypothetical protein [Myxococcales bacterium]
VLAPVLVAGFVLVLVLVLVLALASVLVVHEHGHPREHDAGNEDGHSPRVPKTRHPHQHGS